MTIFAIWAQSGNRVIGHNGGIPWNVKEDFQFFKYMTSDSVILMGRATWESLPKKPLPNRYNVVVTRDPNYESKHPETVNEQVEITSDPIKWILNNKDKDIWIIGGGSIYELLLPFVEYLYITEILVYLKGDTVAPELPSSFIQLEESDIPASKKFVFNKFNRSELGLNYKFTCYKNTNAVNLDGFRVIEIKPEGFVKIPPIWKGKKK